MSRGFAVSPGQLSRIAFIMNEGDAGLSCILQSRQLAAVAAVVAMGAVGGTEWAVCVVVVSFVANGGLAPDGKAMAMVLSASLCAASAILSASPRLVMNWFIGLMDGLGYVLYFACSL